jgi:hypothetical protein
MRMERNGRSSAGQKSRNINIRYFFIKDRIAKGEINLVHCPTGIMVADVFTKPLQGHLFAKFRDIIMGTSYYPLMGWRDHVEKKGKEGEEERRGWTGRLLHGGMDAA